MKKAKKLLAGHCELSERRGEVVVIEFQNRQWSRSLVFCKVIEKVFSHLHTKEKASFAFHPTAMPPMMMMTSLSYASFCLFAQHDILWLISIKIWLIHLISDIIIFSLNLLSQGKVGHFENMACPFAIFPSNSLLSFISLAMALYKPHYDESNFRRNTLLTMQSCTISYNSYIVHFNGKLAKWNASKLNLAPYITLCELG